MTTRAQAGIRLGLLFLLAFQSIARAQDTAALRISQPITTIYLSTQATVRLPPDRATLFIIVDAPAALPAEANERAVASGRAVLDTLRRLGLGAGEARLINYGASPAPAAGSAPMPGAAYAARTVIRVDLRRLDLLPTIATAALNRGATLIGPIQFAATTGDSARRAALAEALAQAKADAVEMARAAGGRLGRLMTMNVNSNYYSESNPQPLPLGGPNYNYEATTAWRTTPEVLRTWNISTQWEVVEPGGRQ
ncbi:MAG TPA: SIMPL domain-containing protein [Gemmatimonadales bacterium]|nr:SIMPL domain-containing protein [Gemmatimonadales bacterium]